MDKYADLGTLEWALEHLEFSDICDSAKEIIKKHLPQTSTKTKEVYVIMSPEGGIGLSFDGTGTVYQTLEEAEKALESKNKWSKAKGYGVYTLVTLIVKE